MAAIDQGKQLPKFRLEAWCITCGTVKKFTIGYETPGGLNICETCGKSL